MVFESRSRLQSASAKQLRPMPHCRMSSPQLTVAVLVPGFTFDSSACSTTMLCGLCRQPPLRLGQRPIHRARRVTFSCAAYLRFPPLCCCWFCGRVIDDRFTLWRKFFIMRHGLPASLSTASRVAPPYPEAGSRSPRLYFCFPLANREGRFITPPGWRFYAAGRNPLNRRAGCRPDSGWGPLPLPELRQRRSRGPRETGDGLQLCRLQLRG